MGFDCCTQYAEDHRIVIYGLFLHRVNAKIYVSKETYRYKWISLYVMMPGHKPWSIELPIRKGVMTSTRPWHLIAATFGTHVDRDK